MICLIEILKKKIIPLILKFQEKNNSRPKKSYYDNLLTYYNSLFIHFDLKQNIDYKMYTNNGIPIQK